MRLSTDMAFWSLRTAAAAALVVLGCKEPTSPKTVPRVQPAGTFSGVIRVDGQPSDGAEAFLLDPSGAVLAAAKTDSGGRYAIKVPAGYAGGWMLAKLYRPLAGARTARLGAEAQAVDFEVRSAEAVTLSVDIQPPPGIAPDWLDVHLTPRALPGLPDEAREALLRVGTENSMRSTYLTTRVTEPRLKQRLLPGTWDLRVERFVDAPLTTKLPVPNLTAASVVLPDGSTAEEVAGGYPLKIDGDLAVRVTLKRSADQ